MKLFCSTWFDLRFSVKREKVTQRKENILYINLFRSKKKKIETYLKKENKKDLFHL
jgi:hypothetical protein